ncbi:hypothetical protein GCM10027340_26060 [Marinomonas epiphytica]
MQQQLEQSNNELSELAFRDALTGLYNRRYLEDYLLEKERPQYLALVDIDNFKRVNDKYGHIMGDQVLQQVAHCLAATLGTDGKVVRWGGEEFALTFNQDNKQAFLKKLDAIRLAITNMDSLLDTPITLSLGGCRHSSNNHKQSLHQADGALYLAKSSGKDCIKFFEEKQ